MAESIAPLLPQHYNDATGFLDYVETDPTVGVWPVPADYAARVRWVTGFYVDDGGPQRLRLGLNLNRGFDTTSLRIDAIPSTVVGGFTRVLWATEITTPALVAEDAGASVTYESLNPLPTVVLEAMGSLSVGFINGTRLQPDQIGVELYPVEGKAAGVDAGPLADVFLLPQAF